MPYYIELFRWISSVVFNICFFYNWFFHFPQSYQSVLNFFWIVKHYNVLVVCFMWSFCVCAIDDKHDNDDEDAVVFMRIMYVSNSSLRNIPISFYFQFNSKISFTIVVFWLFLFNTACRQDRTSIEQPYVIMFISLETDSFSMHF
jgi:hypothetical protein